MRFSGCSLVKSQTGSFVSLVSVSNFGRDLFMYTYPDLTAHDQGIPNISHPFGFFALMKRLVQHFGMVTIREEAERQ